MTDPMISDNAISLKYDMYARMKVFNQIVKSFNLIPFIPSNRNLEKSDCKKKKRKKSSTSEITEKFYRKNKKLEEKRPQ